MLQSIDWDLLEFIASFLNPGESLDLRTGKVSRVDLSGLENPGDAFPEALNPPSPSQESGVSP